MTSGLVSVILPIYKTKKTHLEESINSILQQSYDNLELLLIIDEEPALGTAEFLAQFSDERIIVLHNGENKGLVYSLNKGLAHAKGEYIFRMDADDIALKDRLKRQVAYLEEHKEIDVLGTFAKTFGEYETIFESETSNMQIRGEMLWKNPLIHPTIAFRASFIQKYGIRYSAGDSEDYRLWLDLAFQYNCTFAVLPEVLLRYRIHSEQITVRDKEKIRRKDLRVIHLILQYCGAALQENQIRLFSSIRQNERIGLRNIPEAIYILQQIETNIDNTITRKIFRRKYLKGVCKSFIRCRSV